MWPRRRSAPANASARCQSPHRGATFRFGAATVIAMRSAPPERDSPSRMSAAPASSTSCNQAGDAAAKGWVRLDSVGTGRASSTTTSGTATTRRPPAEPAAQLERGDVEIGKVGEAAGRGVGGAFDQQARRRRARVPRTGADDNCTASPARPATRTGTS